MQLITMWDLRAQTHLRPVLNRITALSSKPISFVCSFSKSFHIEFCLTLIYPVNLRGRHSKLSHFFYFMSMFLKLKYYFDVSVITVMPEEDIWMISYTLLAMSLTKNAYLKIANSASVCLKLMTHLCQARKIRILVICFG